jgi:uncharacterized protein involved in oxidation of intracellular sulfur
MSTEEDKNKKENIVYVLTKGPENAEVALLPFMHAVGALTMDIGATIVLMGSAVYLAHKEIPKHVLYAGKPPLAELMKNFFELGGKLFICTPCYKSRQLDEKSDLIPNIEPLAAAKYNEILLNASAVVSY